jgi:hypothetical protein
VPLVGRLGGVVWRWRKALGLSWAGSEGSRRLIQAAAQMGGKASRERGVLDEEREQRRRRAVEGNFGGFLSPGCKTAPAWTADELALLGTASDEEVAARIGNSRDAVRAQPEKLKIPPAGKPKGG